MKLAITILASILLISSCGPSNELLTDIDGNNYQTKVYGNQVWMLENLRTSKDSDGNEVTFFYANEDPGTKSDYGLLYDYETACKVCPQGWRLPNNKDWETLFDLSKTNIAREFKDKDFWSNAANTNTSGFSVRPTGSSNGGEHDNFFQSKTYFLSKSRDGEYVWTYIFEEDKDQIRTASQHLHYGFSVRCVKDL